MNRYDQMMRQLNAVPYGFSRGAQYSAVSEDEIQKVEGSLGVRSPEDYRKFARDFGEQDRVTCTHPFDSCIIK